MNGPKKGFGSVHTKILSSRSSFFIRPEENTFRILVANDNHLGYLESDPIRKDDSFRTFGEIFQIAVDNEVSRTCVSCASTLFAG